MPRFVRKEAFWAICCSESAAAALATKLLNGMAGMYWPSVPFVVTLYVRLEATTAVLMLTCGERHFCPSGQTRLSVLHAVAPLPLLVGAVFGFLGCTLAGRALSRANSFQEFSRFHAYIGYQSLYYPTVAQVRSLAQRIASLASLPIEAPRFTSGGAAA